MVLAWLPVYDLSGVEYEAVAASDDVLGDVIAVATVSDTKAVITVPADGTYYWRVRAIDGAGNTSSWSAVNEFTVNTATGVIIWTVVGLVLVGGAVGAGLWHFKRRAR